MKSICFLLTKKRATISSIPATVMKLIIVLHCSMLKLANTPSLRLFTHDMHVTWFMKKFTIGSNNKLIAWLHWVIIHYLCGIKKYVILVCITKIKVSKKPMKFIHVENLHRSIFFPTFDSNNAISRQATMNETTAPLLSAVSGNCLIYGCQILIIRKNFCILHKIVFAAINTTKCFLVE